MITIISAYNDDSSLDFLATQCELPHPKGCGF